MDSTIVAIAGGKGGVGRTTTALNLGVALERAGVNTALVDADLAMTNLGEQLGVDPEPGVHGVLAGTDGINDAVVAGPAGLTVVPGDPSLDAFSTADGTRLDRVLAPLAAAHEVVLVDTAAGLTRTHRDVFDRADGVVLVTTPERTGQADAEKTRQVVEHIGTEVLGAVVTAVEEAGAVERVVDRLGVDAVGAIPYDDGFPAEPVAVGTDRPAGQAYERAASALGVFHEVGEIDRPAELDSPVSAVEGASSAGEGSDRTDADDEARADGVRTRLRAVTRTVRQHTAEVGEVTGSLRNDDGATEMRRDADRDPDFESLNRLFEGE